MRRGLGGGLAYAFVAAYGIEEVAVLLGLLTDRDLEELELAT